MPFTIVVPILIFVVLLFVFAVLLRRIGLVVNETRETATFRRSVRDLATRIDFTLGSIIAKIDALRRQQMEADALVEPLDVTLEALLAYEEGGRASAALRPGGHRSGPGGIHLGALDRADRALQMVEHGCAILAGPNQGQRFTEAQTAIKRGYLNVLRRSAQAPNDMSRRSGRCARPRSIAG